jgi:hypothetical protein
VTKRKSPPSWSLIVALYAIAALFLVIVRDELGTDNDPQLKAGGWIALTFAVYWTVRGLVAWLATTRQVQQEDL